MLVVDGPGGSGSRGSRWDAEIRVADNGAPTFWARGRLVVVENGAGGWALAELPRVAIWTRPAAYKASFTDVTAGNNDIYGLENGLVYPATSGYDLASGLGSPLLTNAGGSAGLAYYLCSYATQASRPGVTNISPTQVPTSGGQITISGFRFESGDTSDSPHPGRQRGADAESVQRQG